MLLCHTGCLSKLEASIDKRSGGKKEKDGNSSIGSTENSKVIVGEILEHLWTLNLEVGTFFLEMYLE